MKPYGTKTMFDPILAEYLTKRMILRSNHGTKSLHCFVRYRRTI